MIFVLSTSAYVDSYRLCYMSGKTHYETNTDTSNINRRCDFESEIVDENSLIKRLLDSLSIETVDNQCINSTSTVVASFSHLESGEGKIYIALDGCVYKNRMIYKSEISEILIGEIDKEIANYRIILEAHNINNKFGNKPKAQTIEIKEMATMNMESNDLVVTKIKNCKDVKTNIYIQNMFERYLISDCDERIVLNKNGKYFQVGEQVNKDICKYAKKYIDACN